MHYTNQVAILILQCVSCTIKSVSIHILCQLVEAPFLVKYLEGHMEGNGIS